MPFLRQQYDVIGPPFRRWGWGRRCPHGVLRRADNPVHSLFPTSAGAIVESRKVRSARARPVRHPDPLRTPLTHGSTSWSAPSRLTSSSLSPHRLLHAHRQFPGGPPLPRKSVQVAAPGDPRLLLSFIPSALCGVPYKPQRRQCESTHHRRADHGAIFACRWHTDAAGPAPTQLPWLCRSLPWM